MFLCFVCVVCVVCVVGVFFFFWKFRKRNPAGGLNGFIWTGYPQRSGTVARLAAENKVIW